MTSRTKITLLRLATLVLLCLPAGALVWRWQFNRLGPLPANQATLSTGDWAVILQLLSLALTPARGVFAWPPLVHLRRYIGVAAALYALLHFSMYIVDQNWNLLVVVLEIVKRFYLTIGFVALLILTVLAIISTDKWQRRLKRNWKRLNMLVFPAAVLALIHFFQSKIDVGEATFAAGLFAWLILWRLFPSELRRTYRGLLLLGLAATAAAFAFELGWYGLLKHVNPIRILDSVNNLTLPPRPVHKVLLVSVAVIAVAALRHFVVQISWLWPKRYFSRSAPNHD